MVKHITRMSYLVLDGPEQQQQEWKDMDLVPASCTFESNDTDDDAGRLRSIKIEGLLSCKSCNYKKNLSIYAEFSNGESITFGTKYLPVRMSTKESQNLSFSIEYAYPVH